MKKEDFGQPTPKPPSDAVAAPIPVPEDRSVQACELPTPGELRFLATLHSLSRRYPFYEKDTVHVSRLAPDEDYQETLDACVLKRLVNRDTEGDLKLTQKALGLLHPFVKWSSHFRSAASADVGRFTLAVVLAFAAIPAILLVTSGTKEARDQFNKFFVNDLRYVGFATSVAFAVCLGAQFTLWNIRKQPAVARCYRSFLAKPTFSALWWIVLLETIPFIAVFLALWVLQETYSIKSHHKVWVVWLAFAFCAMMGGVAALLRAHPAYVRVGAQPLRELVILVVFALNVALVYQDSSKGGHSEAADLPSALEPLSAKDALDAQRPSTPDAWNGARRSASTPSFDALSLFTSATFFVVFGWCSNIGWLRRMSPWRE